MVYSLLRNAALCFLQVSKRFLSPGGALATLYETRETTDGERLYSLMHAEKILDNLRGYTLQDVMEEKKVDFFAACTTPQLII